MRSLSMWVKSVLFAVSLGRAMSSSAAISCSRYRDGDVDGDGSGRVVFMFVSCKRKELIVVPCPPFSLLNVFILVTLI